MLKLINFAGATYTVSPKNIRQVDYCRDYGDDGPTILLLCVGCSDKPDPPKESSLIYFQDERTGLCFAFYHRAAIAYKWEAGLTVVPYEKVKDYLEKSPVK